MFIVYFGRKPLLKNILFLVLCFGFASNSHSSLELIKIYDGIRYSANVSGSGSIERTNITNNEKLDPIYGFVTGELIKGLAVDSDGIYVVYDVSAAGYESGTYMLFKYTHESVLIRPELYVSRSGVDITGISVQGGMIQIEITERLTDIVSVETLSTSPVEVPAPDPEYSVEYNGIRYYVVANNYIERVIIETSEQLDPIYGFVTGELIKGLAVDSDGIYVVYDVSAAGYESGTYMLFKYTHESVLIRPELYVSRSGVDITGISVQGGMIQIEITERLTDIVSVETLSTSPVEVPAPDPEYSVEYNGIRYYVVANNYIERVIIETSEQLDPIYGFVTGELIKGLAVDSDGIYVVYDVSAAGYESGTYMLFKYTHESVLIRPELYVSRSGVDITGISVQGGMIQIEITERLTDIVSVETLSTSPVEVPAPDPEYSVEYNGIRYYVVANNYIGRVIIETSEQLDPIYGFVTGELIKGLAVDRDGIYVLYDVSAAGHEPGTFMIFKYTHEGELIRPELHVSRNGTEFTNISIQENFLRVESKDLTNNEMTYELIKLREEQIVSSTSSLPASSGGGGGGGALGIDFVLFLVLSACLMSGYRKWC
ncbi:hypothetical protein NBRC116492_01100 [Aurantivibrio infirmus]